MNTSAIENTSNNIEQYAYLNNYGHTKVIQASARFIVLTAAFEKDSTPVYPEVEYKASCTGYEASCASSGDDVFAVYDLMDQKVVSIDSTGYLCMTGELTQNGNP
jgi:hypothetical protein